MPCPFTIYREVRKLPPGHLLIWEEGQAQIQRYWELPQANGGGPRPVKELEDSLLELLRRSVRSQLMSDVPLGAFLSGGIDSSLIVALMSEEATQPARTFTLGFAGRNDGYLDERVYAREVSARFKTIHTELEIAPDFEGTIDEIVEAFDEPFADDSVIPTFYICKLARQHVKVALTGLGGDEPFGGYERYLGIDLSAIYQRIPSAVRTQLLEPVAARLPEREIGMFKTNRLKRFVRGVSQSPQDRYFSYLSVLSRSLKRDLYTSELSAQPPGTLEALDTSRGDWSEDPLDAALRYDLSTYLPDDVLALTDRLSMCHSLELRVPFLDESVVACCCAAIADEGAFRSEEYCYGGSPHGCCRSRSSIIGSRDSRPLWLSGCAAANRTSSPACWLRSDLRSTGSSTLRSCRR